MGEEKDLEEVIAGDDEGFLKWLRKQTWELMNANDYSDNLRIAIVGNEEQEEEYRKARANGCCGYSDGVYEYKDKKVWIGFNYGH